MVEFLALALGPKHCDLEVKDYQKNGKTIGRISFDIHVKQTKEMEISLYDLRLKLNGKEEKPLFAQFKAINSCDVPKLSDMT